MEQIMIHRPPWLLTKEAILVMMQREGHSYNSVELAVELERRIDTAYAQYRKIAEWMEREIAIAATGLEEFGTAEIQGMMVVEQFIAQAKGVREQHGEA